jgi:hypothetical protein
MFQKNAAMAAVVNIAPYDASGFLPGYANQILVMLCTTAQTTINSGDYIALQHKIEGYRSARLHWGAVEAQPITIGFWTAHARTGTWTGSVRNNVADRSYTFTYTQNVSAVAEYKTVTIPGCTTGTWLSNNGIGIIINFNIAAGPDGISPSANVWYNTNYYAAPGQVNGVASTSDAFRITGVVVLPGIYAPTAAQSPLIMRPFDQELLTCQRYWKKQSYGIAGQKTAGTGISLTAPISPTMRAAPTVAVVLASNTGVDGTPTRTSDGTRLYGYFNAASTGGYIWDELISLDARL